MITLREIGAAGLRQRMELLQKDPHNMERKKSFEDRLSIYRGRHKPLIATRIQQVYDLPSVRKALIKFASTRRNLLKRIANTVAIAYDHPPSRSLKGATPEQQATFRAAYAEADTALAAEEWGRMAFVCNVVHVIPRMYGSPAELEWVTVLPHKADVIFDEESGDRKPSILIYECSHKGAKWVAIDSERWVWLDAKFNVLEQEEHYMGKRPWVTFRFATPPEDDYWDSYNGSELIEGTLDVARIAAQMAWTRKGHANDILFLWLKDKDSEVPSGQVANAEAPIMGRGEIELDRVENIVSVDEFVKEIADIVSDISEGYGIPSTMIDLQPNSTQDAANVFLPAGPRAHAQLAKIRSSQIKHHEHSEKELAERVVILLKLHGLIDLDPEQAEEMFQIKFPPLSFADHPKSQVETAQALGSMGATDPYEFYMQLHPECTFEEARDEVQQHFANRAEVFQIVMTHNMPLDASNDALSVAQIQGSIGGSTKKDPPIENLSIESQSVGEPTQ